VKINKKIKKFFKMSFKRGNPGTTQALVDSKGILQPVSLFGSPELVTEAAGSVVITKLNPVITLSAVLNATTGFALTVNAGFITAANTLIFATVLGTTATAAASRKALTCNVTSLVDGTCVLQIYNPDAANTSAAPKIMMLVMNGPV
jgi:hypothetical protein